MSLLESKLSQAPLKEAAQLAYRGGRVLTIALLQVHGGRAGGAGGAVGRLRGGRGAAGARRRRRGAARARLAPVARYHARARKPRAAGQKGTFYSLRTARLTINVTLLFS